MKFRSVWLSLGSVLLLMSMLAVACGADEAAAPTAPEAAAPAAAAAAAAAGPGAPTAPSAAAPAAAAAAASDPLAPQPAIPAARTRSEPAPPVRTAPVEQMGSFYGGTLTLHRPFTPASFDMGRASGANQLWNFSNERLQICDIDGAGPRGANQTTFRAGNACPLAAIVPHLIESWELLDSTTLIYNLKQGINYIDKAPANGRELEAEDVAVALTRLQNVPRFLNGYWTFMDTIEAVDKYTVQFNFNFYNANWSWLLGAGWYNSIYPRELVEQDLAHEWENVIGTGPFILTDYVTDVGATYEKNPNYWGTTIIDGTEYQLPFVETLRQIYIQDESTSLAAFRTGKLDIIMSLKQEQKDDIVATRSDLQEWAALATGGTKTFAMRVDQEPTSDIRVRKALTMGINWDDFEAKIFGGEAVRRYYLLVPEGWSSNLVTQFEDLPADLVAGHTFNVEGAKSLLAEAGFPDGFAITMDIASDELSIDMASVLVAYWKDIGVDVEINTMERAVFRSTLDKGGQSKLGLYPLADPPLAAVGIGSTGSSYNWARWSPPGYEELMVDVLQETDPELLAEGIKRLNILHAEGFHLMQMSIPFNYNMAHPWVANWYGEIDLGHSLFVPIASRIQINDMLR